MLIFTGEEINKGCDRREAEAHGPNVKYFEDIIKTYFRN